MAQKNAALDLKRFIQSTPATRGTDVNLENAFADHWKTIYRILFYMTGDPSEAEDLALETFTRLWQKPPADLSSLGGWLYRVATRLGYNAMRANRRRRQYETESMFKIQSRRDENAIEGELDRIENRQRVHRVLRKLPERQSKALILRHSGLSYQEIAQVLHISPTSVGSILVRAEQAFLKQYDDPGDHLG